MYIALHYYYQSLSNTKKEMTWKQQENIAYDTKIRYSWWITVAGQAFWHQVSRLSNIFFRADFRLEFLKNSGVSCFFRTGILEEFSRQIHMNFSCHQTATFSTAILIDWNSWRIPGSSAFSHRKIWLMTWKSGICHELLQAFWRQVARYIFSDIDSAFLTGILIGILEDF